MKVTIITVCYNRVTTIEKAIQSALNQDYNNIEYIVIDGNSNDGTKEIIEKYKDQISSYTSEQDNGMYDALNKGLKLATGEVIGLLHSDDEFYDSSVISTIAKAFEQDQTTNAIYGNGIYITNDTNERIIRNRIGGDFSIEKLKKGWLPLHTTVFIKKSIIDQYGGYDLTNRIASDTEFLLRYLYKHRINIKYINSYIVKMRLGGLSTSKSRALIVFKEDVKIYRQYGLSSFVVLNKKLGTLKQYLRRK
ncbi:MAG: glycosyltransferase [Bacteroidetes bacterium]|nr:MAG: glycosyltransferase [Bacteroidota bacterium]